MRPSSARPVKTADFGSQIEAVLQELPSQLEAYPDELIGILCPSGEKTLEIWDRLRSSEHGKIAVLQGAGENAPFQPETQICVSTLHSAKGLEFRAAHVLGCEFLESHPHSLNLTYTAVTRTKTTLRMYHSKPLPGFLEQAFADLNQEGNPPSLDAVFGKL